MNSDPFLASPMQRFRTPDALAQAAAEAWLAELASAPRGNHPYSVALSGGRITRKFLAAVVERVRGQQNPLNHVHFFWADERCVPPDDPESNFRMAQELLFAPLQIAEPRIHRIQGELPPTTAAREAEAVLRDLVPAPPGGQPVLDLIFLGLGEDGHVASLFPGEPETVSADPAVFRAVFNSPKPPPQRVTLGFPAIAAARQVWMLASGAGKQAAMAESLLPAGKTPFSRVLKLRSQTRIFSDIA